MQLGHNWREYVNHELSRNKASALFRLILDQAGPDAYDVAQFDDYDSDASEDSDKSAVGVTPADLDAPQADAFEAFRSEQPPEAPEDADSRADNANGGAEAKRSGGLQDALEDLS
jgi:hypothetical protein